MEKTDNPEDTMNIDIFIPANAGESGEQYQMSHPHTGRLVSESQR